MRLFALISIATGVVHFVGETWWHLEFGQFLPMLIVDYIAIALLLGAGTVYLLQSHSFGLLCGAWGFEFCLNYRAFFSRVSVLTDGGGSAQLEATTYVLGVLLVYSAVMFAIAMYFTYQPDRRNSQS